MDEKGLIRLNRYIDTMPALSITISKILEVTKNPTVTAKDLNKVISLDPVLVGKVLRLVNSAYYGLSNKVTSLVTAIIMLGINTIKNLALSTAVLGNMRKKTSFKSLNVDGFWRHSIVTAMAARALVKSVLQVKMIDPESAFCAGILHDIGKLVFEQYVHDDYQLACQCAREQSLPLIMAESKTMGIDHAGIGRLLAERWALPMELEDSIVSHHDPKPGSPTADVVAAVHLANVMAHELNVNLWDGEKPSTVSPGALAILRLTEASYATIRTRVQEEIEKSDEFFSIINAG